jgi:hypothetical protein
VASTNAYDVGDLVRITGTFRNLEGDLESPSDVVAKVLDPLGVQATFGGGDVIEEGEGVFYMDLEADLTGLWTYRFEGAGTLISTDEASFYVERSAFAAEGS